MESTAGELHPFINSWLPTKVNSQKTSTESQIFLTYAEGKLSPQINYNIKCIG